MRIAKTSHKIICLHILAVFIIASVPRLSARGVAIDDSIKAHKVPPEVDVMDIIEKGFNVKHDPRTDSVNMRPWVVYPAVFPAIGYTTINGGTAVISANFSFYTDSIDKTNLSVISLNPLYSLKHQVIVPAISSIWLKDNKINLLGDWRYYQYPSYTYGLGNRTLLAKVDSIDYSYFKFYQECLVEIKPHLYGGIGYNLDYHWNIKDYGNLTDFQRYDHNEVKTVSSGLVAHLKYDDRENMNNPKNSFYGSLIYRYNSTLLGSDNNWQSVQLEMRKYIKLTPYGNNILAFWSWNEFTFGGRPPYLDLPSTGWDTYNNMGRGYIQGRFRGANMVYLESEFRFNILRNGLLGGVVFCNAETVSRRLSDDGGGIISPGEGIGLRIKMNRFSDTNLCIDYGFGTGGSQGFFFNLGEVF